MINTKINFNKEVDLGVVVLIDLEMMVLVDQIDLIIIDLVNLIIKMIEIIEAMITIKDMILIEIMIIIQEIMIVKEANILIIDNQDNFKDIDMYNFNNYYMIIKYFYKLLLILNAN